MQVRASFLLEIGVFGNLSQMSALSNEFILGGKSMADQQSVLDSIDWLRGKDLTANKSFGQYSRQVGPTK